MAKSKFNGHDGSFHSQISFAIVIDIDAIASVAIATVVVVVHDDGDDDVTIFIGKKERTGQIANVAHHYANIR